MSRSSTEAYGSSETRSTSKAGVLSFQRMMESRYQLIDASACFGRRSIRQKEEPKLISRRSCLASVIFLCSVAGCGRSDGKLNVTGKVVKGGAPLTVPEEEYVRVTFFPVTDDGSPPKNTYATDFNRSN